MSNPDVGQEREGLGAVSLWLKAVFIYLFVFPVVAISLAKLWEFFQQVFTILGG